MNTSIILNIIVNYLIFKNGGLRLLQIHEYDKDDDKLIA